MSVRSPAMMKMASKPERSSKTFQVYFQRSEMFVEARNPFRMSVESQRDSEEGWDGHLCYKHAVPTELSRNFSIY